ncbi:hypothetical protein EAS64_30200 [Trebonia kvetii]|uniref:Uncharacterized protein n=1 Tax=Trebonia kvetii TaxID=2480626 RepID=A0A6P2BU35_9ACTN|nr:hypothetical protein [Trebonia kvetii]TVZ01736.1 hypothetical protein EAS64_30200 [Trebonia kvetii]
MSREWPPGWEDPEDAELDAEELDEETDVRLAEVAAFLATVSAPVLPGAIESRIIAALAAESAARGEGSPARAPEPDGPRILRPAPARARVRRGVYRVGRFDRIRPAMVAGPLVAILLFSGLGYAISLAGGQSSSSSAASAPSAASSAAAGAVGGPQYSASSGRAAEGSAASTAGFALIQSGTDYRQATLAEQVQTVIAAAKRASVPAAVPSATTPSSSAASASAPATITAAPASTAPAGQFYSLAALPPSLHSCVAHFTGGAAPRLIDLATYQGTPAYVIATSTHVWVVGLDCTAQHLDLIASASLAG